MKLRIFILLLVVMLLFTGLVYAFNFKTGGGTDQQQAQGILVPSATGAQIGGTASNPIVTSTTATVSGNVTVIQGTGTNLHTVVDSGSIGAVCTNAGTFAVQSTDSVTSATEVHYSVDFTESQTAQTIWTPTSSKKFVITDVIVSASAAGTITVFDGTDNTTNRIFKISLPANGGMDHPYKKPRVSATANNVLKYTTGSGIAGSITVSGYEI